MGPYYVEPDNIDVSDDLREVVETLARDCAGAIQIHGPRRARYYDTADTIHPRALNHVRRAGGHFAAVEQLPAPDEDRDDLTWHGSDCEPGAEVGAFEFHVPDADPIDIDHKTAAVAHEAIDQLLILGKRHTASSRDALIEAAREIGTNAGLDATPRTDTETPESEQ